MDSQLLGIRRYTQTASTHSIDLQQNEESTMLSAHGFDLFAVTHCQNHNLIHTICKRFQKQVSDVKVIVSHSLHIMFSCVVDAMCPVSAWSFWERCFCGNSMLGVCTDILQCPCNFLLL